MDSSHPKSGNGNILQFWRWRMHHQVFLGMLIGVGLGTLSGLSFRTSPAGFADRTDGVLYDFVGDVFMQGLSMLIVPLIVSSIITAMAGLADQANFARMGTKTLVYYAATSFIAVLTGLILVNAIQPGTGVGIHAEDIAMSVHQSGTEASMNMEKISMSSEGRTGWDILNVFREIVPDNLFRAASRPNMLGLVLFSLLFGIFLNGVETKHRDPMVSFWEATYSIMVRITHLVLRFLPLGVCALLAKTTAETCLRGDVTETLSRLALFALTVLVALGLHAFVVMPLLLSLIGKVNPWRHVRAMGPALLTAFSTASSSATLPVTMRCVQNRAGVSKTSTGFVLPVGATVNMDGTALYECVAVMFLAQFYGPTIGVELGFTDQLLVVMMALLTSIGVAGIPSASLVAIVLILNAVNARIPAPIPKEALAIILIFDRPLDMCRTVVNVWGDSCGAVIIGKSEGEAGILVDDPDTLEGRLTAESS